MGEIFKVFDGPHTTPNYIEEGIPFFSVESYKKRIEDIEKFISKEEFIKNFKNKIPEKNDLFVTRIGDIGSVRLIEFDNEVAYYVTLALLKPQKLVNSSYYKYLLESKKVQKEFWNRTLHIAFPQKINLSEIEKINLYIHNFNIQSQVANFLSSIDILIEKQEEYINQLKEQKQGYMQKIFAQELRVKGFRGEWNIVDFEDYFYKEKIKTKLQKVGYLDAGNIPIVSQEKELINGYTNNTLNVNENNILLGDHTLVLKYLPFKFVTGGDGVILLNTNYNLVFGYNILKRYLPDTEGYKRHFSIIKKLKFSVPSLEEQNKIASLLSSMDKLIELNKEKLEQLKLKKKYYLNEIFK